MDYVFIVISFIIGLLVGKTIKSPKEVEEIRAAEADLDKKLKEIEQKEKALADKVKKSERSNSAKQSKKQG